ncbi:MAG: CRISPR-associated endonuclease Cas2 [Candidatus Vogelbacteria bacterium CG10_big_fil_rev_8_21_14_0_10_49_38]|uniref:CRISPR-associated endonuclease Cas2 n=1 Tax=Candidatus Vogelbacteria bacterium CG10_big_fil_rev_8_21_14_0_10_49_38 TaxID=1975043 RepID=A0A2H0RIM5_9BACT|nr:MAG: CRISPR-associated endonuclease Cas2 [bacterium CG10_49_38]PIR46343.1 MAG: CRISPR-associated endonuclease Cas2 [Candidatus Vogelbacteria bacterium CG10_big_fil_rev_8_21_14_0_10_49_38]
MKKEGKNRIIKAGDFSGTRKLDKVKKLKWLAESDLTKAILASIAIVGFVTLAAAVPGILKVVGQYQRHRKRYLQLKYVNQRLSRLIEKGLIKVDSVAGEKRLILTLSGERELEKGRLLAGENNQKKWDGKWRVVIFDISEKRRKVRDFLRMELRELGFMRMQNSVWVSPFDCVDYLYLLKADIGLGRAVIFFEVTKLENEKYWRQKFGFSL